MTEKNNNKSLIKTVSLTPPSLQDNTADAERLIMAMQSHLKTNAVDIDLYLLRELPVLLRKWNYNVRCIFLKDRSRWILTGITNSTDTTPIAGIAVDLGTTKVVLRIIDLSTDQILAEATFDNPQIALGPDILTRIHYSDQDEGLKKINRLIIDGLNQMIEKLCGSCNIKPDNIYAVSVAGNTAMTHFFMGLNPHWLIREPYIPVVNKPGPIKAKELGININPLARVIIFPNVGSYFGGDLIAGILFSGIYKKEDISILVDVGTNAEVLLGNKHWLVACAGAAGPALEGGVTKIGMLAGPGVIDRITIDPDSFNIKAHTIDDKPPKGICGSGLIDLAACLFLYGIIDIRGRFVPSMCGNRLKKDKDNMKYYVVVPANESGTGSDLTISQADLDSLIRSKAAMYTILETITSSVGMSLKDLSTFYVAGTFGSYIDPKSAISIGMLPDLPIDSYKSLGNSSLGGATMAITSDCLNEINNIRDRITYLELNVNQEFMNRFSAAKFLPHTDISLFPSVQPQRHQDTKIII